MLGLHYRILKKMYHSFHQNIMQHFLSIDDNTKCFFSSKSVYYNDFWRIMWLELWCWKFSFAITEKNIKIVICIVYCIIWSNKFSLGARFTKQGKLAQERNSKTAPMCMEMSAADLLTPHKWKNTDTTSHLHIDQRNIPSAAQISLVANKRSLSSSGVSDLLTTLALNSLRRDFWGVK